jgi:hypothetical protein
MLVVEGERVAQSEKAILICPGYDIAARELT